MTAGKDFTACYCVDHDHVFWQELHAIMHQTEPEMCLVIKPQFYRVFFYTASQFCFSVINQIYQQHQLSISCPKRQWVKGRKSRKTNSLQIQWWPHVIFKMSKNRLDICAQMNRNMYLHIKLRNWLKALTANIGLGPSVVARHAKKLVKKMGPSIIVSWKRK